MLALRINRLNGDWQGYWAALPPDRITKPRSLMAQVWFAPEYR